MRGRMALAGIAALMVAAPAFAQRFERVSARSALPNSPVMRDSPAMAQGFSPLVAVGMLDKVCLPAAGGLKRVEDLARLAGLDGVEPLSLIRAGLPDAAQFWRAESLDSDVYLYAYGAEAVHCGVAIVRPLDEAVGLKVREQLVDAVHGFALETDQAAAPGVRVVRLRSAHARYLDLVAVGQVGDQPSYLRIELLP